MPQIEITIVPRQVGQILDETFDHIVTALCRKPEKPPLNASLKDLIGHRYYPTYDVYQGKCYQQHTGNLCGYHATYNALCCLNMYLGMESEYLIQDGACFWKFKKKVEKFLLEIKQYNKLGDAWPWRDKDIQNGDFERTYNNICVDLFDDFDVFKQGHNQFEYMSFTWEFQFQNLLLSDKTRLELNRKIDKFRTHKSNKPLIFGVMLAITGHWTLFMAFKKAGQSEYWFFDSHNRDLLNLGPQEIEKHIQELNEERKREGRDPISAFHRETYAVRIKDTQISVKLLVDCLEGRRTIDQYTYNQVFNVFSQHIEKAVDSGMDSDNATQQVIKSYWYNISSFYKTPIKWDLLTPQNTERMKLVIQLAESYRKTSFWEGRSLHDMIRRANPKMMF